MTTRALDIVLFETREVHVRRAVDAGISSVIIDWEWRGKSRRQAGIDTEINRDTVEDLERLSRCGVTRRFCRLNCPGTWTRREVDTACAAGATDLLLPMFRLLTEVEQFVAAVGGRCRAGVLVETVEALYLAPQLAACGVHSVYVGLNDLAIERGSPSIFLALVDGTVDRVRAGCASLDFGVAGATVVDCGHPLSFPVLLAEMARLHCQFTFARRSFKRDIKGRALAVELQRVQEMWAALLERDAATVVRDQREIRRRVHAIVGQDR